MIMSKQLFVISNAASFWVNFNLSIIVFCAFLSITLIMANDDISSMNDAFTFINLCSLGFNTKCPFGNNGIDLFKKLKQESPGFITPSNSNIFLISKLSLHSHEFLILMYIFWICNCVYLIFVVLWIRC